MKKWICIVLVGAVLGICACGSTSAGNGKSTISNNEESAQSESSSDLEKEHSSPIAEKENSSGNGDIYDPEEVKIISDLEEKEYALTNVLCKVSYGIDTTERWEYFYKNVLERCNGDTVDKSGGMLLVFNYTDDFLTFNDYVTPLFAERKHQLTEVFEINGTVAYVGNVISTVEFLGGGEYEIDFDGEQPIFKHSENLIIPPEIFKGDIGTIVIAAFLYDGQKDVTNIQALCYDMIMMDYQVEGESVKIIDIKT